MTVVVRPDWHSTGYAASKEAHAALSIGEWVRLVNSAVEPSIAHDPAWLMPALKELSPHYPAELITLGDGFELSGIVAMQKSRWRWGLPLQALVSWHHPHHFLGTPLVSETSGIRALSDLILRGMPLVFTQTTLDGGAMDSLKRAADTVGAKVVVTKRAERACYRPEGHFDDHLKRHLPRKRRKEFRRLKSRLAELGTLRVERLGCDANVDLWFDRFEALEASGWKGRRGTALRLNPRDARLMREAGRRLHLDGRLLFWEMSLNDQPVAMLFAMISGNRAWLGKIAHDEAYGQYSPGALIIIEASRDFDDRPDIRLVDSCAVPDHSLINRLWHDRLAVGTVIVIPPGMPQWQASLVTTLESGRQRAIPALKTLRNLVTRR